MVANLRIPFYLLILFASSSSVEKRLYKPRDEADDDEQRIDTWLTNNKNTLASLSSERKRLNVAPREEAAANDIIQRFDRWLTNGQFTYARLSSALDDIASVGILLDQATVSSDHNRWNNRSSILVKLKLMGDKIGTLADKTYEQFTQSRGILGKNSTFAELVDSIPSLFTDLLEITSSPTAENLQLFLSKCASRLTDDFPLSDDDKNKLKCIRVPRMLADKLFDLLERNSENPLKLAMAADRLKTTETFKRWEHLIDGVFGQLLFLETVIDGMLFGCNGPVHKRWAKTLAKRIEMFRYINMRSWEQYYRLSYWPTVVGNLVEDVRNGRVTTVEPTTVAENFVSKLVNRLLGGFFGDSSEERIAANRKTANLLRDGLSRIMKDDTFYVLVYDDVDRHAHNFHHDGDHILHSHAGDQHILIYRACQWKYFSDKSNIVKRLQKEMKPAAQKTKIYGTTTGETSPFGLFSRIRESFSRELMEKLSNVQFVGIFRSDTHVAIRSVNIETEKGPGWWEKYDDVSIVAGYSGMCDQQFLRSFKAAHSNLFSNWYLKRNK